MTMKKFLAAFLSAAMVVTSAVIPVFADEDAPVEAADEGIELMAAPWSGSGTSTSPYLIKTPEELAALSTNYASYSKKYFKLNNDIDLKNISWMPIGTDSDKFQAYFDGNNKKFECRQSQ